MNLNQIKQNWNSRGYTYGFLKDPLGQVWTHFVHITDELVVLAERAHFLDFLIFLSGTCFLVQLLEFKLPPVLF